jgi:hypothetical protein
MYTRSRTHRWVAALGGASAFCLALALPAGPASADPVDVGYARNGGVLVAEDHPVPPEGVDLGAARNGGTDPYLPRSGAPEGVDVGRLLNSIDDPGSTGQPTGQSTGQPAEARSAEPVVADDSWEYQQIALGAAAGAALTGLLLAAVRQWGRHHAPRPV